MFLYTAHRKWVRKNDLMSGKLFDDSNKLSDLSLKSFSTSDQNNKSSDHSRYL